MGGSESRDFLRTGSDTSIWTRSGLPVRDMYSKRRVATLPVASLPGGASAHRFSYSQRKSSGLWCYRCRNDQKLGVRRCGRRKTHRVRAPKRTRAGRVWGLDNAFLFSMSSRRRHTPGNDNLFFKKSVGVAFYENSPWLATGAHFRKWFLLQRFESRRRCQISMFGPLACKRNAFSLRPCP